MNKEVFLHQLRVRLTQLPPQEAQKQLDYYAELIDDMMEDGVSEEAAVASFGDVNLLAQQILQDASLSHLVRAKATPKKRLDGNCHYSGYHRFPNLGAAAPCADCSHRLHLYRHRSSHRRHLRSSYIRRICRNCAAL